MIYLPTFSHKESTKCIGTVNIPYLDPMVVRIQQLPPPGWTLHLKILWKYSQRFPPSEAPLKLTASSTNSKFAPEKYHVGPHKGKERIFQKGSNVPTMRFSGGFLLNLHREKKNIMSHRFFWGSRKRTSWWFQPLWKISVKMGSSSPNRGENKKYLNPPIRKES